MALILLVGAIPSSVDADDERQTRKKIVFWNLFTGGSSHEVVTELVARFNHRQQEYVVEQVDVPGGHITAKILPAVAGGVPLDESHVDQQEYGGNPDTDGRQASGTGDLRTAHTRQQTGAVSSQPTDKRQWYQPQESCLRLVGQRCVDLMEIPHQPTSWTVASQGHRSQRQRCSGNEDHARPRSQLRHAVDHGQPS
tara:strand:- start:9 stop:596 length:588 start_codon:yes stop_codon:yes gene_type:complete